MAIQITTVNILQVLTLTFSSLSVWHDHSQVWAPPLRTISSPGDAPVRLLVAATKTRRSPCSGGTADARL